MNAKRYLLILVVLILPVLASAQRIGGNKYKVTTGDTTKIVSRVNTGLKGPEFEFLFNTKGEVIDSLYNEIQPNTTSAKAVVEVNDILKEIERDQAILKAGNTSLSYRLSREYVAASKKEKSARAYADSMLLEQRRLSEKEQALKYMMYGDKPSYFVNGMPVDARIADLLLPGDVIERNIKTNSSNPNGEIWLILTEKAMRRLRLPTENTEMYGPMENILLEDPVQKIQENRRSEPVRKIDALPEELPIKQKVDTAQPQNQQKSRTVVRSRTVNNKPVEVRND